MATLYADASDRVLVWYPTEVEEATGAPVGAVRSIWFDEITNVAAAAALTAAPLTALRLTAAGVLTLNGAPVTLAPPRPWVAAIRSATALQARVGGALAQLRAISTQAGTLSTQQTAWTLAQQRQVATAIKTLADDLLAIGRLAANQLDATD